MTERDFKKRFHRPYVGIIVNCTSNKSRENILSKYSTLGVKLIQEEKGTLKFVIQFGEEWPEFEKAVEFEKHFRLCKQGKSEWVENKANPGSRIFGWLAQKDDCSAEGQIGEYLNSKEIKMEDDPTIELRRIQQLEILDELELQFLNEKKLQQEDELTIRFSWREPYKYQKLIKTSNWKKGETPLPKPINQGKSEICIACAIKVMMETQMQIMVKGRKEKAPKISLAQIRDELLKKHMKNRTLEQMLKWVATEGVASEKDYRKAKGAKKRTVKPGATRYKVTYDTGYDPESGTFFEDVTEKIIAGSVLIGEFKVKSDYDWTGEKTMYMGKGAVKLDGDGYEEGHAVLLTGSGQRKDGDDDSNIFEYLNSYGERWSKKQGFGEIEDQETLGKFRQVDRNLAFSNLVLIHYESEFGEERFKLGVCSLLLTWTECSLFGFGVWTSL